MLKVLQNCKSLISNIERTLFGMFPPGLNFAEVVTSPSPAKKFSIQDVLLENILWAVQKHRRTVEKRMMRRIGSLDGMYKCHLSQKDMIVCVHCGHDHKRGFLCKNCFNKVMEETKQIQDKIIAELKLNPIEHDVIVLYEGEKDDHPSEFWEGKRIIEMPKERPAWFSRNLLQRTTTTVSDAKDIKPDHLA